MGYTINQKPFQTNGLNLIEICNEFFVLVTGYFMMLFSEWMYDPTSGGQSTGSSIPGDKSRRLLGRGLGSEEYQNDPAIKYNYGYGYLAALGVVLAFNSIFIL